MSRRLNKPDTRADIDLRECLKTKTSFVVVAGAGSGKTTSLIKALQYIDNTEGKTLRQQGKRVACITYTTVAEKEILDDVGHDPLFHVSTIHSFLWELIRPFQPDIKKWIISKIDKKIAKLIEARENFGARVQQRTRDKNEADTLEYREMAQNISQVNEFKYETGSNYLKGILGHNDIISIAPDLITNSPLLQNILAEKYPYFFIDESQDTLQIFIDAMKIVDRNGKKFCLGFFGDPMQKIYNTGAGPIALEEGWALIEKPENFRCATDVLDVINEIRKKGDNLHQTGGRKIKVGDDFQVVKGSAYIFILIADDQRDKKIQWVRTFMSEKNAEPLWLSDSTEADVKILVIEHRMAAKRLGFEGLFSAYNDNSSEGISSSFKEGSHWGVQPFLKFAVPLVLAFNAEQHFDVIELLRNYCPQLQKRSLKETEKQPGELLKELKDSVSALAQKFKEGNVTVGTLLKFIREKELMALDERITSRLDGNAVIDLNEELESDIIESVMARYFEVHAVEMLGYQKYVDKESAFSTQHGVKGAEFERVVVVLDDEEGNSNTLSYDKLFGLTPLSETDDDNIANGRDNTPARTRRLFYVCCSRALQDLAVVLFTDDVDKARAAVEAIGIFPAEFIKNEDALLLELLHLTGVSTAFERTDSKS